MTQESVSFHIKRRRNYSCFVCCLKVNTIIPKSQSHLRSGWAPGLAAVAVWTVNTPPETINVIAQTSCIISIPPPTHNNNPPEIQTPESNPFDEVSVDNWYGTTWHKHNKQSNISSVNNSHFSLIIPRFPPEGEEDRQVILPTITNGSDGYVPTLPIKWNTKWSKIESAWCCYIHFSIPKSQNQDYIFSCNLGIIAMKVQKHDIFFKIAFYQAFVIFVLIWIRPDTWIAIEIALEIALTFCYWKSER